MIKYYAVFDKSRESYCTDLIPCDDDIIALRWFSGFVHKSTYALTTPNRDELLLVQVGSWESQVSDGFHKTNVPICTPSQILDYYREHMSDRTVEIQKMAVFPEVKTEQSEGQFVRAAEKQINSEVADE